MKTLYLASASAAILFMAASCSETYDILPEEYAAVVRLKSSGLQDLNVYSIQDQAVYPITVMKGGHNPEAVANATLRVLSEDEFNDYLLESGAGYSYIPAGCYEFKDGTTSSVNIAFTGEQNFEVVDFVVNTEGIKEFLDAYTDVTRDPVIPMVLEFDNGMVDNDSRYIFLKPNYSEPILGFSNLEEGGIISLADGLNVASLRIAFDGMASPWDMNCTIAVDPSILEEYNSVNHTSIGLMPAEAYSNLGDILIEEGSEYVPLNIEIDLEKSGFRTAIPVSITSTDINGIKLVNNKVLIVTDNASGYKLNLVAADYTSPDDAFLNETCTGYNGVGHDGTGSAALCDGQYGDWTNFWSSCYFQPHHYDEVYNSYIEIDLHKSTTMVGFDYSTRAYYKNVPHHMRVWAWNGSEWKMIGRDMDDFKEAPYIDVEEGWGCKKFSIGAMVADFEFTKVRFSCVKGNNGNEMSGVMHDYSHLWECGELEVYAK